MDVWEEIFMELNGIKYYHLTRGDCVTNSFIVVAISVRFLNINNYKVENYFKIVCTIKSW